MNLSLINLAPPAQPVANDDPQALARLSPEFAAFMTQAVRDSGIHTRTLNPALARYRLVRPEGEVEFDLDQSSLVKLDDGRVRVAEIIAPYLAQDCVQWILQVWQQADFDSLKALLRRQRAIVRFEHGMDNTLHGHVVPAQASIARIEAVEQGRYILDNGDLVTDGITRTLGLRTKVLTLHQALRLARNKQPPNEEARPSGPWADRFGETLIKWRR